MGERKGLPSVPEEKQKPRGSKVTKTMVLGLKEKKEEKGGIRLGREMEKRLRQTGIKID